jgi:hypothetical protein
MKKQIALPITEQLKRLGIKVRTQLRAGAWKRCGALECDTQDKGKDPGVCKSLRCR